MNTEDVYSLLQTNPLEPIIAAGGGNGEDDLEFKRILRTDKFYIELHESSSICKQYRRLFVIERIFEDSYENLYIAWVVKLASGEMYNPFHFIGLHETTHQERRDPDDFVGAGTYRVPQSTIDKFRENAILKTQRAQIQALQPAKKRQVKKDLDYNPNPVSMEKYL